MNVTGAAGKPAVLPYGRQGCMLPALPCSQSRLRHPRHPAPAHWPCKRTSSRSITAASGIGSDVPQTLLAGLDMDQFGIPQADVYDLWSAALAAAWALILFTVFTPDEALKANLLLYVLAPGVAAMIVFLPPQLLL